jgi:hypothetical protein
MDIERGREEMNSVWVELLVACCVGVTVEQTYLMLRFVYLLCFRCRSLLLSLMHWIHRRGYLKRGDLVVRQAQWLRICATVRLPHFFPIGNCRSVLLLIGSRVHKFIPLCCAMLLYTPLASLMLHSLCKSFKINRLPFLPTPSP